LDPIFTPMIMNHPDVPVEDPRIQALEVQLEAKDDLIDNIKSFLKRSLLPSIQQERIPVVVPLGSPTEFRAYAEGWQAWVEAQRYRDANVPSRAVALVNRLEEYAKQIEGVRALRSELVKFSGKLLEHEQKISDAIGGWFDDDILEEFADFLEASDRANGHLASWKGAQNFYRSTHDYMSMPWCHNDRFTTPIYSLLDSWLPGRNNNGNLDGIDLPTLSIGPGTSASFDFTALKILTGSLSLPVLDPIQVRIRLSSVSPPDVLATKVNNIPTLPPLPALPQINSELAWFPDVFVDTGAMLSVDFTLPDQIEMNGTSVSIGKIRNVIYGMRREYQKFWNSVVEERILGENETFDRGTEQDCYRQGTETCVHTEEDLIERITRLGSRPAILLQEDFGVVGELRPNPANVGYDMQSCPKDDWACQFLGGTKDYPMRGWNMEWTGTNQDKIDFERGRLLDQTLFQGTLPYETDRKEILPSFAIPPSFPLIPNQEGYDEEEVSIIP